MSGVGGEQRTSPSISSACHAACPSRSLRRASSSVPSARQRSMLVLSPLLHLHLLCLFLCWAMCRTLGLLTMPVVPEPPLSRAARLPPAHHSPPASPTASPTARRSYQPPPQHHVRAWASEALSRSRQLGEGPQGEAGGGPRATTCRARQEALPLSAGAPQATEAAGAARTVQNKLCLSAALPDVLV